MAFALLVLCRDLTMQKHILFIYFVLLLLILGIILLLCIFLGRYFLLLGINVL